MISATVRTASSETKSTRVLLIMIWKPPESILLSKTMLTMFQLPNLSYFKFIFPQMNFILLL